MKTFKPLYYLGLTLVTWLILGLESTWAMSGVESGKSLLDLYKEGGPVMHIIALCSVGCAGLGGFLALQLRRKKILPEPVITQLNQVMSQRNIPEAFQICKQNPGPLTHSLTAALTKANFERDMFNKTAMENAVADAVYHEETKIQVNITYLNTLAVMAPMIGLLGTTAGMINSFGALTAGKAEATDLAGGIGEALVCTAGGLFLAIPSMFFYFFFRGKAQALMVDVHKAVSTMLDLFTGEVSMEGLAAAQATMDANNSANTLPVGPDFQS
jgi:biopolymer transport protein ExbB